LNITPIAQQLRKMIEKKEWTKLKSFYTAKETFTRQKSLQNERKSVPAICLTRDWYSDYTKSLKN
jgi:hypothetical protein